MLPQKVSDNILDTSHASVRNQKKWGLSSKPIHPCN